MNVVFLDIDGVLVSEWCFWRMQLNHVTDRVLFDHRALKALKGLVERTGAKVVITSSWRPRKNERPTRPFMDLQTMLAHNLTPVYDVTPVLESDRIADRSDEIAAWLTEHPDVESFAVLDDNDRFHHVPAIRERWVEVNARTGLTAEDCEKAARWFEI